jgi:hypothetical protein
MAEIQNLEIKTNCPVTWPARSAGVSRMYTDFFFQPVIAKKPFTEKKTHPT